MNRLATIVGGLVALLAIAGTASGALRVPQVAVIGGSLQAYLTTKDGGITVLTDQEDIQRWHSTTGSNSTFTLQLELGLFAPDNTIGIYNASEASPPLYEVFPGSAGPGWFALAAFRTAPLRVVVSLFDAGTVFQGSTTYLGADKDDFGFYLSGPGGLFYTQDSRNAGSAAQALTFSGTGVNAGSWWLCWEDLAVGGGGADSDFDDAVLFLESVNPTPVIKTSWGQLKARFR